MKKIQKFTDEEVLIREIKHVRLEKAIGEMVNGVLKGGECQATANHVLRQLDRLNQENTKTSTKNKD